MISFITIVLDGMPWIPMIYQNLKALSGDWEWIVIEGVAANVNCTKWCADIPGRLSNDGTTEWLKHIASRDARIIYQALKKWEHGKVAMFNYALRWVTDSAFVFQMDADEIWMPDTIRAAVDGLAASPARKGMFFCRYWVGPDRYILPERDVYGNHTAYEWKRLWKFNPINCPRFETHEPPVMEGEGDEVYQPGSFLFDHFAYASRKQMEFRAQYYAGDKNPNAHLWRNCLDGWDRLQQATLPCKLKDFFPWVDDKATVVKA